jgi:hypothetical protein
MPESQTSLKLKVDAFLEAALTEPNHSARAKLLGKAVYWNDMGAKAEAFLRRQVPTSHHAENRAS